MGSTSVDKRPRFEPSVTISGEVFDCDKTTHDDFCHESVSLLGGYQWLVLRSVQLAATLLDCFSFN